MERATYIAEKRVKESELGCGQFVACKSTDDMHLRMYGSETCDVSDIEHNDCSVSDLLKSIEKS